MMPALNFNNRFGQGVRDSEISMAIRRRKPGTFSYGCRVFLWENQRTKARRFLGSERCIGVSDIIIINGRLMMDLSTKESADYWLDDETLESIARSNGYKSYAIMERYFSMRFSLPYEGTLIEWEITK
jgi:hypothetical protein